MSYREAISVLFLATVIAGCARAPVIKPPKGMPPEAAKGAVYHKVVKGETLWRISKDYGVDLDTLVRANRLSDAGKIKAGQMILIPAGSAQAAVRPALPRVYSREDFIWPVRGRVISSFGQKKGSTPNKGIDIQAREGTVVVASVSGKVIFSEEKVKGFGRTVIIDHGDGIQTVYSHNSEILVKIGEYVRQAQPVAKTGSAGRGNYPYLHFEIRKGHKPQNPFYYLP